MSRWWWAFATVALISGCDSGGGGGGGDADALATGDAGADAGADARPPDVPYEGALPPLAPDAVVDEQSFFPVVEGGTWRYRKKADDAANPGPVTQGGEATMTLGEDGELVRETVSIFDLETADGPVKVRQVIRETYGYTPAVNMVGPIIEFRALSIEEREVETGRFIRTLNREYLPPYKLFPDAWRTGQFEVDSVSSVRAIERRLLRGDDDEREQEYLVDVRVKTDTRPKVLIMDGQFREDVRKIDVYDDSSNQLSRTYWVQPGVGIVQWRYKDTNNITYTLTETNLEQPE